MADIPTEDKDLGQELADAFAADEAVSENPASPAVEESKSETPKEEPEANETTATQKPGEETQQPTPPAAGEEAPDSGVPTPEDPNSKAPENPEETAPQAPLTRDDVTQIISKLRNDERTAVKSVEQATNDVLNAYYPDGLSDVLVDQNTGKELRYPQDVVDASGGDMSLEEATQWLMNEKYKLNENLNAIRSSAEKIAETTLDFVRDSEAAIVKYQPLFDKYPHLQQKAYNLMMKQVEVDMNKNVILKAPDVLDLYDTYLEPYQQAFELATNEPATNPTPQVPAPTPTPGVDDRLDENGDAGATTEVDDPNDFAQQVNKELAKGI